MLAVLEHIWHRNQSITLVLIILSEKVQNMLYTYLFSSLLIIAGKGVQDLSLWSTLIPLI